MIFIKSNLNPTGKANNDCVVRAIMKATGKTWIEVYDYLCFDGRLEHDMPNSKKVYHKYLAEIGWKKQPMPRHEDRKRYTIAQFANENPKGTFIISVAHHLTCLVDGKLYDTWDCGNKSMNNYWIS